MKTRQTITLVLLISLITQASAQICNHFNAASDYYTVCNQIVTVGCSVLLIIQGISAAVAVLIIVLSGIRWIGSEFMEDPQKRTELKQRIVYSIVGLLIVMLAVNLINFLMMGTLAPFSCGP